MLTMSLTGPWKFNQFKTLTDKPEQNEVPDRKTIVRLLVSFLTCKIFLTSVRSQAFVGLWKMHNLEIVSFCIVSPHFDRSRRVSADLVLDAGHGYQRPTKSDTEPDNLDEGEAWMCLWRSNR
jgi:hypothetical protein